MNVVIVGRPNVGKSSIFNRLLGRKRSLVLDTPGVTRDRIVEPAEWWVDGVERHLNLIDTGGLGEGRFREEIAIQVRTALEEASVVLFVMDIRAGLTSGDEEVFAQLRKAGLEDMIPVIGVLNKTDHEKFEEDLHQFYKLGLDLLITVSAEHALGIDDLKDTIIHLLDDKAAEKAGETGSETESESEADEEEVAFSDDAKITGGETAEDEMAGFRLTEEEVANLEAQEDQEEAQPKPRRTPAIAIVGQPNVGKSTILNAICGEKRAIVSPIAGTTVDSIDTKITWHGKDYILIDTAGIRRKNKTEQGIEVLSIVQTKKTLDRADLALLMIDGEKGVYDQDEKIAGLVEEAGCSVILILNKWDTQVNNDEFSQKKAEEELRKKIRFLGFSPLLFTTATDGTGLERVYRNMENVLEQRSLRIHTREITEFIRAEMEVHNPFNAKVYFVHQAGRNPPTFVAHVNDPKKIHFSQSRHLIKAIRDRFGFTGSPIRFHFIKAKNTGEKRK